MMTSTNSPFNSMPSEAGQSTLSTKIFTSTMTNMTPTNTIFVTPKKSKRSCIATTSPPVPTKKQIRLPPDYTDGEEFGSPIPCFPLLLDEDDMCDDTPDTPIAFFNECMEEDDMMYCTPRRALISPLSVGKVAIPPIRLKPRLSGVTHEYSTTDESNTQDLPPILIFPQDFDESVANPIRLKFRSTGVNLTLTETFYHACDSSIQNLTPRAD